MLKKARAQAEGAGGESADESPKSVKETSRQIWLAGLGALSRAQSEGMKVFETLVEQGQNLEARTRRAASETAAAAAGAAAQKAKEVQAMAGGTWDKLEQVFEDRVAKALSKLGVYTQEDVARLAERVDALSEAVNALIKSSGAAVPAVKRAARRKPAKSTTAKPGTTGRRARAGKPGASAATEAPAAAEPARSMPAERVPRKSRKRAAKG